MKHKEIQKKMLRYINAQLPQEEMSEIKHHLELCKTCQKKIQILADVWKFSNSINRVQPSPILWNKISKRIDNKNQNEILVHKTKIFILHTVRPALTTAIVILGLFIGINLGNRITMSDLHNQMAEITTNQLQNEFGLENFQILSSGSLGGEMATLMANKNN